MTASSNAPAGSSKANSPRDPSFALCFCADGSFLPGLSVALGSALVFSADQDFRIYVGFDADDAPADLESAIDRICERVNSRRDRVHLVPLDFSAIESLTAFRTGTRANYGRLLLIDSIEEPVAIYLDSDTLVFDEVAELAALAPEAHPLAALQDPTLRNHGNDDYKTANEPVDPETPYFNSGVLVLNTRECREFGLRERVLEAASHIELGQFRDQTYLNYVLANRWTEIPRAWNKLVLPKRPLGLNQDDPLPSIIHYVSAPKPWDSPHPFFHNLIWHNIARDLGVPIDPAIHGELIENVARMRRSTKGFLLPLKRTTAPIFRRGRSYRRRLLDVATYRCFAGEIDDKLVRHGLSPLRPEFRLA